MFFVNNQRSHDARKGVIIFTLGDIRPRANLRRPPNDINWVLFYSGAVVIVFTRASFKSNFFLFVTIIRVDFFPKRNYGFLDRTSSIVKCPNTSLYDVVEVTIIFVRILSIGS